MSKRLRTLDVIIIVILIVVSTVFVYRSGYLAPLTTPVEPTTPTTDSPATITNDTLPPTSLVPAFRRDVAPVDEGVHFDSLRISREWWYYTAMFTGNGSALAGWTFAVGFSHLAAGDLLGTGKPDLLSFSLLSDDNQSYGGMVNKRHYLGVLNTGTLVAESPGVRLTYETSWVEGTAPRWHVHAEDGDIDAGHEVVVDLDYQASSLPVWTMGSKAFDQTDAELASYVFLQCSLSGTVTIDGTRYVVEGVGSHEHTWSPLAVSRVSINGWDWLTLYLDNGWALYATNYLPTPQAVTEEIAVTDPFGTLLLTTDGGTTITELRDVNLRITSEERVIPFVSMPTAFHMAASPSLNPLYALSQALLVGTRITLSADLEVTHSVDKVWTLPTYVGMTMGYLTISGTLSWTDNDGEHSESFSGIGVSNSMRALL